MSGCKQCTYFEKCFLKLFEKRCFDFKQKIVEPNPMKEVYCLINESIVEIYNTVCRSKGMSIPDYAKMVKKLVTILEMDEFQFKPKHSCIYLTVRGRCVEGTLGDTDKDECPECKFDHMYKCPRAD